jgi:bis(5'-nucleosyl)-tetraphosphatase (symmetrical)
MALYAIGDVQGCDAELGQLLDVLRFSPDKDRLWFVGDLVNRGPASLEVLRRVRALGDAASVTLGNHDLHLLALAHGYGRLKRDDTLSEVLRAPDRDDLIEWLAHRPLCVEDRILNLCLLHAGLSPQWDMPTARRCAREFEESLRHTPTELFEQMYGDDPDLWDEALEGAERLRYIVNCFTRLRYVDGEGRLELHAKGSPKGPPKASSRKAQRGSLIPWYEAAHAKWRGTRLVFGHWSTLGFFRNAEVTALDTGCVWGGSLTALRLDVPDAAPVQVPCSSSGLAPGE